MILLRLDGDLVKGYDLGVDMNYQPKENEVLITSMPEATLSEGEIAIMYYRNGNIEFEIIRRDEK